MGVSGGVVIDGTATGGIELRTGVGALPGSGFGREARVAMDDCELDRVGLPGLTWKVVEEGAGEGAAGGGGNAGDTFARLGETAVGVVKGVFSLGYGAANVVEMIG